MHVRIVFAIAFVLAIAVAPACGGDDDSPDGTQTAAPGSPTVRAGLDPTEEALLATISGLGNYVLRPEDLPAGFDKRSNVPVSKREAAVANVAITPLAEYLNGSDLAGAWATLYTRNTPESGVSSLIYSFATAEGARGLVSTLAGLEPADYPGAASVDRAEAEDVGDASQLMVYRLGSAPGSNTQTVTARTLEYTWAQGRFAGQVILRYAGDVSNADDIALIVGLARTQAERMGELPQ